MLLHRSGFTLLVVAQYYLVFVERKPGRRPKTVNLAVEEKEASRKRARRRAAKANFSRSVVFFFFLAVEQRQRETLSSASAPPSLCTTSTFMSHSPSPFPSPLSPPPSARDSGKAEAELAAGGPVQRRCEPSNRLSLPSGASHTKTQLKGAVSNMLASVNHYHVRFDTLV